MTTLPTVSSAAVLRHIDSVPHTAMDVTVALYGPQNNGVAWWQVSTRLDWLVQRGRIETRKQEHVSVYWRRDHAVESSSK